MSADTDPRRERDLVESLAAIEHERWSHWQRHMHGKGTRLPDGSLLLPADLVERWEAQMTTDYSKLSEAEKESDREQVRRYLPLVARHLGGSEADVPGDGDGG